MKYSLIVAFDNKCGIGKENELPWNLKNEMKHFTSITKTSTINLNKGKINAVVMGRNTWESIPDRFKPLSDRINIIVTSKAKDYKNDVEKMVYYVEDIKSIINLVDSKNKQIQEVFIIGGVRLYNEFINSEYLNHLYLTEVYDDFDCDTCLMERKDLNKKLEYYNLINCSEFKKEYCELNKKDIYYRYLDYMKKDYDLESNIPIYKNLEEEQYMTLLKEIKEKGIKRGDRTGTGTLSVFGKVQKFNLEETFPLLTTKRMFLRGIFEELMLYLTGKTDNKILNEKGIHIWDGNTSKEFLEKRGLNYQEGDMGETYGFNFRHFGGDYQGCHIKYEKGENGFDQLENVIHLIKNDPESRRIIITLWNPKTNHKAALPSCLCWYQFYVDTNRNKLNLLINIRSSDFFLANNWNVCTGALLCHLLCNLEGIDLEPGELTVVSGDTHLYINHLEQVEKNLLRTPRPFPKLLVKEQKKKIEHFTYEDLVLLGYNPYPGMKAPMAV